MKKVRTYDSFFKTELYRSLKKLLIKAVRQDYMYSCYEIAEFLEALKCCYVYNERLSRDLLNNFYDSWKPFKEKIEQFIKDNELEVEEVRYSVNINYGRK